jgi:hypothetical protein
MATRSNPLRIIPSILFFGFLANPAVYFESAHAIQNQSDRRSPFEAQTNLQDFNVASVGDMGCASSSSKIFNIMNKKTPNIFLILGDLSYQKSPDCWIKIISPVESRLKIVFGEHDHNPSTLLNQYKNHFNLSQEYYSLNYQNVHFVALATEIPFDINSSQYAFVKNDLEVASKNPEIKWIVVFSYRPQYSSPTKHTGNVDLRDIYHPLFQKYHVDIVLQAHNHNYQRTYPINYNQKTPSNPEITNNDPKYYEDSNGQIYITVGTGGAKLYSFTGKASFVAAQYEGFGFLDIFITNNGRNMTGTFYNSDNLVKDSFTLLKSR